MTMIRLARHLRQPAQALQQHGHPAHAAGTSAGGRRDDAAAPGPLCRCTTGPRRLRSLPAAVAEFKAAVQAADGPGPVLARIQRRHVRRPEERAGLGLAPRNAAPLKGKHVLIMSSSPAFTGGVRAHTPVARDAREHAVARLVHPPVVIAGVHEKIKEGRLVDESNIQFALGAIAALVAEIRLIALAR